MQILLGILWLVDGALQLQPFMFGKGFATQVIDPAAAGQPTLVRLLVTGSGHLIGLHPVLADTFFATVQLALGAGLLLRRTARPALAASIIWALGIWAFGEGFGGVFGGHTSLLLGAPGAALIYAVLAAAAWPQRDGDSAPASWLPAAWSGIFALGALLWALPWQFNGRSIAGQLTSNLASLPGPVASVVLSLATFTSAHGHLVAAVLVALGIAAAVLALRPGRCRTVAATLGATLALAAWASSQAFGGISTGQATDPNTGPLLVLLAAALAATNARRPVPATARYPVAVTSGRQQPSPSWATAPALFERAG